MPNSRSAEKRMRQSEKRRLRNSSIRSRMRTQVKKVASAAGVSEREELALRGALSAIDKAAKRGVVHRNAAARRKSRLMRKAHAAAAQ